MRLRSMRAAGAAVSLVVATVAAACTPPAAPAVVPWKFDATQIQVTESQDEVRDPIFGACISFVGCSDEPYVMNVNFSVTIGQPGSAQTFVTGGHGCGHSSLGGSSTATDGGCWRGTATFNNVAPIDISNIVAGNGKLTVFGSYSWILEEDQVGVGLAADGTAGILKDALNQTLAAGQLPSDLNQILDLVLDNLGDALGILAGNIPVFGLGDDVIGGGIYIGIGATGDLAGIIDGAIGSATIPTLSLPLVELPPDITRGGIFTMSGTKNFPGQQFRGGCSLGTCGNYTFNFQSGPA